MVTLKIVRRCNVILVALFKWYNLFFFDDFVYKKILIYCLVQCQLFVLSLEIGRIFLTCLLCGDNSNCSLIAWLLRAVYDDIACVSENKLTLYLVSVVFLSDWVELFASRMQPLRSHHPYFTYFGTFTPKLYYNVFMWSQRPHLNFPFLSTKRCLQTKMRHRIVSNITEK